MTSYAPSWLFGLIAVTAMVGMGGCSVRMAVGFGCSPSRQSQACSRATVLFLLVGLMATTYRVLGA